MLKVFKIIVDVFNCLTGKGIYFFLNLVDNESSNIAVKRLYAIHVNIICPITIIYLSDFYFLIFNKYVQ